MDRLEEILKLSDDIRYVALYVNGKLEKKSKIGLVGESDDESDKYEELLVNPTLIKLAQQRGEIDCGGMNYLIIRYGNFYQLVKPIEGGHVSVAISKEANPLDVYPILEKYLLKWTK